MNEPYYFRVVVTMLTVCASVHLLAVKETRNSLKGHLAQQAMGLVLVLYFFLAHQYSLIERLMVLSNLTTSRKSATVKRKK